MSNENPDNSIGHDPHGSAPTAHADVVGVPGAPAWCHPRTLALVDARAAAGAPYLRELAACLAQACASSDVPVDHAICLHGSAAMTRLAARAPDLDVHARLRFRPAPSPDHPHTLLAGVGASQAGVLTRLVIAMERSRAIVPIEIHAVYNGPLVERSGRPAGFVGVFTPLDVLAGSSSASAGVSVDEACLHAVILRLMLIVSPAGCPPRLVDLAIDRSVVQGPGPGRVNDVAIGNFGCWFGKVCFSAADASRIASMERELGTLFPDRYDPARFAPQTHLASVAEILAKNPSACKLLRALAQLAAWRDDAGALRDLARRLARIDEVGYAPAQALVAAFRVRRLGCAHPWLDSIARTAAADLPGGRAEPRDAPLGLDEWVTLAGAGASVAGRAEAIARADLIADPAPLQALDPAGRSAWLKLCAGPATR